MEEAIPMVELKICSFCGAEIEPGTGKMYVKKDGTVLLFCTNKCSKNMVDMRRVPRRTTWTRAYAQTKDVRLNRHEGAKPLKTEKAEEPKVEAPKAEEPKVEAPMVEAATENAPASGKKAAKPKKAKAEKKPKAEKKAE
jgi:large subunit ribosomal protein L24e